MTLNTTSKNWLLLILIGVVFLFQWHETKAQCPPSANGSDCGAIKPKQSAIGSTTICASADSIHRTITFNYTTSILVDKVCISFGDGTSKTITPTDTIISFTHTYSYPQTNLCPHDMFQPPVIFDVVANFTKTCSPTPSFSFEKVSQQVTVIFDPRPKIDNTVTQCLNDSSCIFIAACEGILNIGNGSTLCSCTNADAQHSGSYTWNFGDGTSQTFNNITDNIYESMCHVYPKGGKYTITLSATNYCGTKTDSIPNIIFHKIDSLQVLGSGQYCTGDKVMLNLVGSGGSTFNTSVISGPSTPLPTVSNPSSTTPSIIFTEPGIYTISVKYGVCSINKQITILEGVSMIIDTIPDGCLNGTYQLDLAQYYTTYNLNQTNTVTVLHNGTQIHSGGFNTINLTDTGMYSITVVCSTSCNSATYSQSFKLKMPVSIVTPPDTSVCVQSFYNVLPIPGTTLSGDATTPGLFSIADNRTYNFIYTPGCGNASTLKVTGIGVKALANDANYCSSPGVISLTSTKANTVFSGIGVTGNQLNAPAGTHYFYTQYTDTLTGCVYQDTGTITIAPSQQVAMSLNDTVCTNIPTTLTVLGGSSVVIDWGDSSLPDSDTSHIYTSAGIKYITATFTKNQCDTVLYDTVVVISAPSAQFSFTTPDTVCEGAQIGVTTTQDSLFNYLWVVNNVDSSNVPPQFVAVNTSNTPQSNSVSLLVMAQQCAAVAHYIDSVIVNPATKALMAINYDSVCSPLYLSIINNSVVSASGAVFEWYRNDTLKLTNTTATSFQDSIIADKYPVSVTYTLIAFSCGKYDTTSKNVVAYPPDFSPVIYASAFQGCAKEPLCFSASPIPGCTVSYDFGDGTYSGIVSSVDTVCHEYVNAGQYNVNLTMFCACKIKTDNIPINISNGPEITVVATQESCTNNFASIKSISVGSVPTSDYFTSFGDGTYNHGQSSVKHSYSTPGYYYGWVSATGINGCRSDSMPFKILVHQSPNVHFQSLDTFACSEILTSFSVDTPMQNTSYLWSIYHENRIDTTITFDGVLPLYADKSGQYAAILTAINNNNQDCRATSDTLKLTVYPSPIAVFQTDPLFVIGEENKFQLLNKSTPAESSFFWNFGDSSYSYQANPAPFSYKESGTYTIKLIATNGPCTDTAINNVFVFPYMKIYVPNTFSPNGDGINDLLEIYGNTNDIDFIRLRVFNRLGEEVFKTDDKHFKWDGNYKGEPLLPNTFVYTLEISVLGNSENKLLKGSITLLR